MLIYHIINRSEELAATTNLRTAKSKAKELKALAILAVETVYTPDGVMSFLTMAYIDARRIGRYVSYTLEELKVLSIRNVHYIPDAVLYAFKLKLE